MRCASGCIIAFKKRCYIERDAGGTGDDSKKRDPVAAYAECAVEARDVALDGGGHEDEVP